MANDPINATDPTGIECVTQGENLVCDPPGDDTAPFTVPKPEGFPDSIKETDDGYHNYRTDSSTPDHKGSLKSDIEQEVINNPTPGDDQPATPGGTVNDAGISPAEGPNGDNVISYVTTDADGNTVVVNITIPGEHVLNPGYVAQYITSTDTRTTITTVGEGAAPLQDNVGARFTATTVFRNLSESRIRRAIYNNTNRRRR